MVMNTTFIFINFRQKFLKYLHIPPSLLVLGINMYFFII